MDDEERPEAGSQEASEVQSQSKPLPDDSAAARYRREKESDMDKLAREIEERQKRDTRAKTIKWWIKTGLLLALIGLSIFLLFSITDSLTEDSIKSFPALIRGINPLWLCILIGVILLYIVFESAKYFYLLRISTGKNFFRASVKVMFLGKYYDGITPLGSGGQPFQIYYLHKKNGIPAGVATAVPLVKFTVTTVVFCIVATVMFSFAPVLLKDVSNVTISKTIIGIAWAAMAVNFLLPVLIIAFSLFPNFGRRATAWIVSTLAKLHIVRRKYPVMRKYLYEVREYRASLKAILSRWWHFIPLAALGLVSTIISQSVPFFVIVAIADVTPSWWLFFQMLCLSMLSFYSASLVPTPGNSGALEGAAALIFATTLSSRAGAVVGWVILVWRLLTYYLYIFAGIGINIFEIIRSAYRKRKAARAAT